MKKIILLAGVLVCFFKGQSQFSPGLLALKDVNILDVISGKLQEHYTVLIRDTKI
jgi:hypothetical protein